MDAALTWWGHATALIELGGVRMLTDPVLRRRFAHLTRRAPAPEGGLGALDAVLISHVHRDHLDLPTLKGLDVRGPVVVPKGAAAFLPAGVEAHELAAGADTGVGKVRLTATPAVHDVRRGFPPKRIPALGYLVEAAGTRIYFAGDTDLFDGMRDLGPLDLALIPVWGWGTTLGDGGHLDPREAAEAVAMLRPRMAIPIHWGTYFPIHLGRGGHPLLENPPHDFVRHVAELAPEVEVRILSVGERLALG